MNNSFPEKKAIEFALEKLDIWFENHGKVITCLGEQNTANGYQLTNIQVMSEWIKITLYMLDRSIQEKDVPRDGDKVVFTYYRENGNMKYE